MLFQAQSEKVADSEENAGGCSKAMSAPPSMTVPLPTPFQDAKLQHASCPEPDGRASHAQPTKQGAPQGERNFAL